MSDKKFRFISPGVFIDEIDKSRVAQIVDKRGPLIIGRAERGPSMRPVTVNSFAEFVEKFGNPVPGGATQEVWRNGNFTSPMYATYAAQAYLKNNAPITFVRLLGVKHDSVDDTATDISAPGWKTTGHTATGGGAYGLFLFNSGSSDGTHHADAQISGTLGAIFYVNGSDTHLRLSGSIAGTSDTTSSAGTLIVNRGNSAEFRMEVVTAGGIAQTIDFNFDRNSKKYIRNVFNTNPTLLLGSYASPVKTHFLGESFESRLLSTQQGVLTDLGENKIYGTLQIMGANGTNPDGAGDGTNFKVEASVAKSGWVIGQNLGNSDSYQPVTAQKLFRFETLTAGDWDEKNIKISIRDLKFSNNQIDKYGTFTVVVRSNRDSDAAQEIYERFEDCNLNPSSPRFIARVIGDKYVTWSESARRLREHGQYANNSKFIRVVVSSDVEAGVDPKYLPAGFHGPPRYTRFSVGGGATPVSRRPGKVGAFATSTEASTFVKGGQDIVQGTSGVFVSGGINMGNFTASVVFPTVRFRASSIDSSLSSHRDACFGYDSRRSNEGRLFDEVNKDLVRQKPRGVGSYDASTFTEVEYFTLDDLSASYTPATSTVVHAEWVSGSHAAETSITAVDSLPGQKIGANSSQKTYTGSLESLIELGYDKFTLPLFGGSDGLDITHQNPLRNSNIGVSATETSNYIFNTYKRAIDFTLDRENLDINVAIVPGLTNETLTGRLLDNCEERSDVLGIIDLTGDYTPKHERTTIATLERDSLGTVSTAVSNLKARNINNSYGCAYYPFVLARDTATSGQFVWLPPSVVALGVMGNSEARSELWFAPAGFNRGGLSEGAAGIPVVGVRQKLNARDRDELYNQNVNPIASFPSEGIVVFGQKTLQATESALDRINVRRLVIFLKKEISFAASRVLFDQNVRATWNRFTGLVEPLLESVQARFGLTDFKLVLDETTTTDELVDRNILYAKVFLKPARAIEYIALDFVITATGASFEE